MDISKGIMDTTENIRLVQKDFAAFTSYNNMFVVFAAAICVGIATRDLVTDVLNETILPLILFFTKQGITYMIYTKILEATTKYQTLNMVIQHVAKLLWIILVWMITLFLVYLIFNKLIKVDLVTSRANLVDDVTRYFTHQEAPPRHLP